MAANIFTGVVSADWSTATNWSLGAVPTVSDGNVVTLNSSSPACTTPIGSTYCNSLDCTGYTHLFSTNLFYVNGNVTMSSSMTMSGNTFRVINNSTITSNGFTFPVMIAFDASATYTLYDNLTCGAGFTIGAISGIVIVNGFNLIINANRIEFANNNILKGTSKIVFKNCYFKASVAPLEIDNDIDINGNTDFMLNAYLKFKSGTIKYVSGTPTIYLNIIGDNTLDLAGCVPSYIISSSASKTITLASALTISGKLSTTANTTFVGAYNIQCATFECITAGVINTFLVGQTFVITTLLTLKGAIGNLVKLVSSTPSTSYTFKLNTGASQKVQYVDSSDADSSTGQTIINRDGKNTRTTNWGRSTGAFFNLFK